MYNQTKHKERKYFCMYCLQCFSSEDILTKHKGVCIIIIGEQAIKMPEKGEKYISETTINVNGSHLSSMPISKPLLKKYKSVGQIMISHTLKLIKPMKTVDMATKLSVAITTNILNQHRCILVRMLYLSSWKKC